MSSFSLLQLFYEDFNPQIRKGSKDFRIKPSSLGTNCYRKLYYDSFSVPNDFDVPAKVKKMGKVGTGVHHILSDSFRSKGILIDWVNSDGSYALDYSGAPDLEFRIEAPELSIKLGKIDAVVDYNKELWLSEYKTSTGGSFNGLTRPKDDHMIQGVLYLYIFNQHLKDGKFKHIKKLDQFTEAKGIRFIYVDRDNLVDFNMKEFVITTADNIFSNTINKIFKVKKYAEKKELPPKTLEWCNNCSWRTKCEKNYNVE